MLSRCATTKVSASASLGGRFLTVTQWTQLLVVLVRVIYFSLQIKFNLLWHVAQLQPKQTGFSSVSVGKTIVIAVTVTLVVLGIIAAIAGIIWKKQQSPILPMWVIMTLLEAIVCLCFCKLASMRVITCWFNLCLQCNKSEEADSRAEPGLPQQTASTQLPCIRPTGDVLNGAGIWSKNCSDTFLMIPEICRLADQSVKDLHLHHLQLGPNPNQSFRSTELHQLHQGTNPHHPFQTTQLHGRYQSSPAFNQFSLLFQLEKKPSP